MSCCSFVVRHTVCFLAFVTWLLGSIIIAYVLWMLSTSSNFKNVFEGTTPVTYVLLGLGSLFFTNGLLGWMGSQNKKGSWLLKLFLLLGVLTIAAEIGGIITLSILKVRVSDIVEQGWMETNPKTRHLIQEHFVCCGLTGPSEYAKTAEPIDISCYHNLNPQDLTREELASLNSTVSGSNEPMKEMSKHGCREKILSSLSTHKVIWISILGGILLLQSLCFCLTVSALNLKGSDSIDSLDRLHATTYM